MYLASHSILNTYKETDIFIEYCKYFKYKPRGNFILLNILSYTIKIYFQRKKKSAKRANIKFQTEMYFFLTED